MKLIVSYVLDWIVLIIVGIVSAYIDTLEPRKRPFSLNDPNISCVKCSFVSSILSSEVLTDSSIEGSLTLSPRQYHYGS